MIVFNLACEQGHLFEAWFASSEAFTDQQQRGLLNCPICTSPRVQKMPAAPRLNLSAAPAATEQKEVQSVEKKLREVLAQSAYVGEQFTEQARKMHYHEIAVRSIYGTATVEQTSELLDEGIAVLPIPFPFVPPNEVN